MVTQVLHSLTRTQWWGPVQSKRARHSEPSSLHTLLQGRARHVPRHIHAIYTHAQQHRLCEDPKKVHFEPLRKPFLNPQPTNPATPTFLPL